jgi:predicted Zn-dependent peptidase
MQFHPKIDKLKSGLTLISCPLPSESVGAILMVKVGSRNETPAVNGISHFFEHMPFKGTKKWPTAQAVNQVIDSRGGVFNAFTNQEQTAFWVKLAKKHLATGLEFLHQLIFQPLLPAEELERERGVILEEIKMRDDDPMICVGDSFEQQIFQKNSLGQPVIGTPENIKSLKREQFFAHLNRWYRPENMVLVIAGGIGKDVKKLAEEIFVTKRGKAEKADRGGKYAAKQTKPDISLVTKKIEQAHFALGLRTFKRNHPDRYALGVLKTILGGSTSSRLWNEIREKRGLAYYVRTSNDAFFDTGYLVTQAGCAVDKAEEALKITIDNYALMAAKKVTNEELTLAKEYLKGRLALSWEDSQDVAGYLADDYIFEGKIRSLDELYREIDAVSAEKVLQVAKTIFDLKQLNLTVVSPLADSAKFARLLA